MRTIIPAIATVIVLCVCTQWQIDQWQYFREAEERLHQLRAAQDVRSKLPTSQPSTQPAPSEAITAEPE
jgi:hypothetical protein